MNAIRVEDPRPHARVTIVAPDGTERVVSALLDPGSEVSCATPKCLREMGLVTKQCLAVAVRAVDQSVTQVMESVHCSVRLCDGAPLLPVTIYCMPSCSDDLVLGFRAFRGVDICVNETGEWSLSPHSQRGKEEREKAGYCIVQCDSSEIDPWDQQASVVAPESLPAAIAVNPAPAAPAESDSQAPVAATSAAVRCVEQAPARAPRRRKRRRPAACHEPARCEPPAIVPSIRPPRAPP